MLNGAKIPTETRAKLWAECASTATKLENLICDKAANKSSYYNYFGKHPEYSQHLRTFGEMGIVAKHSNKKIKGKLED